MKNNLTSRIATTVAQLLAAILTCVSTPSWAQTSGDENALCRDVGIVIAFFNGVLTTPETAALAKQKLREIYGNSYRGEGIRYELMYNHTAGVKEDLMEVFEQRLKEQEDLLEGRFELFFEALRGRNSLWGEIVENIPAAKDILDELVEDAQEHMRKALAALATSPVTVLNHNEHVIRIDTLIREGKKLLFLAHSQGNLFANAAYEFAMTKTTPDSVKVVHIAPASIQLNGPHVLADKDIVINLLNLAGGAPSVTDNIPGLLQRPPGLNGKIDLSGHGLLEIYLNPYVPTRDRITGYIQNALNTLVAPPVRAKSGFFTLTLVWDGPGNIDLHVYEPWDPDRKISPHVYFDNMTGKSGYLNTDNQTGYGPEQYRATCNPSKLATGMYFVGIANREGADGRFAAVQLASSEDGVLDTRFATMYEPTGETTRPTMFLVYVKRDPQTGRYKVTYD